MCYTWLIQIKKLIVSSLTPSMNRVGTQLGACNDSQSE